jgi:hypothetical protein
MELVAMADADDVTFESTMLDRYPEIRDRARNSQEFQHWRETLKPLDVDGTTFYVRDGDRLKDENQILFEWARANGLLTDEMLASPDQSPSQEGQAAPSSPWVDSWGPSWSESDEKGEKR